MRDGSRRQECKSANRLGILAACTGSGDGLAAGQRAGVGQADALQHLLRALLPLHGNTKGGGCQSRLEISGPATPRACGFCGTFSRLWLIMT